jgi:hypothetical protein
LLPKLMITVPTTIFITKKERFVLQVGTGSDAGRLRIVGIARAYEYAIANRSDYAEFFDQGGALLGPGLTVEEATIAS